MLRQLYFFSNATGQHRDSTRHTFFKGRMQVRQEEMRLPHQSRGACQCIVENAGGRAAVVAPEPKPVVAVLG